MFVIRNTPKTSEVVIGPAGSRAMGYGPGPVLDAHAFLVPIPTCIKSIHFLPDHAVSTEAGYSYGVNINTSPGETY